MKQRQEATDAGTWVREAALAYAQKRKARKEAAMKVAAE
jgi:ring-1,2-phenylacetyl-CoA epoxidase subunit PaaA